MLSMNCSKSSSFNNSVSSKISEGSMEFTVRRAGLALRLVVGKEVVTLDEGVAELLFVTTPTD